MSPHVLKSENVDYGTNLTEINHHAHIYHRAEILGCIFFPFQFFCPGRKCTVTLNAIDLETKEMKLKDSEAES